MNRRKDWNIKEDQLISQFVFSTGTKKWTHCSSTLLQHEFIRKPRQCRDRWFNYLDPKIQKNSWKFQQQIILFESIQKYGSRWCEIEKHRLPGRTQNSIKNQFYSLVRCTIKTIAKICKPKIYIKIKKLSPVDLFEIYIDWTKKKYNLFKQMMIELKFEIRRPNVMDFIFGKKKLVDELFQQVSIKLEQKWIYSQEQQQQSEVQILKESKKLKTMVVSSENSTGQKQLKERRYYMVEALIPIYIDSNNQLKLANEQNLVKYLNIELSKLDIMSFI